MITKNAATVNLDGTETTVKFDRNYDYFWVHNLGDKDVLISVESGISEGADGVIVVPAGASCGTMHGYERDTLYLLGSGRVQVMGTDSGFNPFKVAKKGDDNSVLMSIGIAGLIPPVEEVFIGGEITTFTEG